MSPNTLGTDHGDEVGASQSSNTAAEGEDREALPRNSDLSPESKAADGKNLTGSYAVGYEHFDPQKFGEGASPRDIRALGRS